MTPRHYVHLSAVTAWMVRDAGGFGPDLAGRVGQMNTHAASCTLWMTDADLAEARDALKAFVASAETRSTEAYRHGLAEITRLAGEVPTDDG